MNGYNKAVIQIQVNVATRWDVDEVWGRSNNLKTFD